MASCAMAWALNVECTPGELHNLVAGESFTALTITGSLDARDFKYISEQMPQLTSINLSQATIVKYKSAKPLFANELDYQADAIPEMAFFDMNIEQVVLPENIKAIGTAAFAGCTKLTAILFPASLETIGAYAFSSTGLKNVSLPAGIKTLGEGAFSKSVDLTRVTIEPAASFTIAKGAFLGCSHIINVTLGENVTAIGDQAFKGTTRLQDITFSGQNNLQSIGKEAFLSSGITNFDFATAQSLTTVDQWAFAQTKQVSAQISNITAQLNKGAFYYAADLSSFIPNNTSDTIAPLLLAGTAVANVRPLQHPSHQCDCSCHHTIHWHSCHGGNDTDASHREPRCHSASAGRRGVGWREPGHHPSHSAHPGPQRLSQRTTVAKLHARQPIDYWRRQPRRLGYRCRRDSNLRHPAGTLLSV